MRGTRLLASVSCLSLLLGAVPPAIAADNVSVTVLVRCLEQVESPDSTDDGDYYPEVTIGNNVASTNPDSSTIAPPVEDDIFCPDWRFTRSVDRSAFAGGIIPILIRLWDDDGGTNFARDLMDINPHNDKVHLDLKFNSFTGEWDLPESDVKGNIARGDGDHGFPEANDGRIAQIEFEIYLGSQRDRDGDGIPDAIETNGVRDAAGTLLYDLRSLGADPCRPTIVVWIDYMTGAADEHSHQPEGAAIAELVAAFDAAPVNAVACEYGGTHRPTGVDFIHIPGKSIPEQTVWGLTLDSAGNPDFNDDYRNTKNDNFPAALRPWAHYVVFGHDQPAGSTSSGLCCDSDGGNRDFIVTLGSWRATCVDEGGPGSNGTLETIPAPGSDDVVVGTAIDVGPDRTCNTTAAAGSDDRQLITVGTGAADARVGTVRDQAGTIMHELGHALGLGHGGETTINYKPNYLSAMNYAMQFGIPRGAVPAGAAQPPRVLDYSRAALPDLHKASLKESLGIGDSSTLANWTRWSDPAGTQRWANAAGGIDWDWSGTIDDGAVLCADGTSVCVNVNLNPDNDAGTNPILLTGFDDWSNLTYRGGAGAGAGAGSASMHPGIADQTFEQALEAELAIADFFDPDLEATKTVDKADAEGGDVLTYSVTVKNIGPGPADNVSLTDVFPAGQGKSPETRQLGKIYDGGQKVETFTLSVACDTADGTVLVNSAAASGTDFGGGTETNLANNTDTASTTVHAPKLDVAKSASGTGLAGEAITYTITITNVGSAIAKNIAVTDVLPGDVYYSEALDVGGGPTPDGVTGGSGAATTLTWNDLGQLAAGASISVTYSARPSLLFLGGEVITNAVEVRYKNASGLCTFGPERASASKMITIVAPTRDPLSQGYWSTHPDEWSAEIRARIQATDQSYDTDLDGALSSSEVEAMLSPGGNMDTILKKQLLATYFNLGSRRINAATLLDQRSKLVKKLALVNVRDAARYGQATLLLPVTKANRDRYSDATTVLDQINLNKIEVY